MTAKQRDAFLLISVTLPVIFLARAQWLLGTISIGLLCAAYLFSRTFKVLREHIKYFGLVVWIYPVYCGMVGFLIEYHPQLHERFLPLIIIVLFCNLFLLIKPYRKAKDILRDDSYF